MSSNIRDFLYCYVKVPGGLVEDCQIIRGEVFSNRITKRRMPRAIEKPKVLLLSGAILYHR